MNIGAIGQSFQTEFKKTDTTLRDKSRGKSLDPDKTSFTPKAVGLGNSLASVETVRTQIDRTPDLREEKLADVRAKIGNGRYDSPDLIDNLAGVLSNTIFVA